MKESPLKIRVAKTVLRGFRRRALKRYPKELMEMIWGKVTSQGVDIFAFHPVEHKPSKLSCEYTSHTESDIEAQRDEEAPSFNLEVLGTIHSHPDCSDASPSEADWELTVIDKEIISGICLIRTPRNGKKRLTRIRLYSGAVHDVEVTKY